MSVKIKKLNHLLPLVAIGTIADCQSILESTNRTLVKAGLAIMQKNQNSNVGLQELLKQTGLEAKINQGYKIGSQDLAFTLSPILNSSGRISHACISIALLLAKESVSKIPFASSYQINQNASNLAAELIATNNERKQIVKDTLNDIETNVKEQSSHKNGLIWIEKEGLNKGIIGLLASRLVNQHNIPTIIVSKPSSQQQVSADEVNLILEKIKNLKNQK